MDRAPHASSGSARRSARRTARARRVPRRRHGDARGTLNVARPRGTCGISMSVSAEPTARDDAQGERGERNRRRRSMAEDALNIPNLLTMARVLMIPLFLWFLDKDTPRSGFWAA